MNTNNQNLLWFQIHFSECIVFGLELNVQKSGVSMLKLFYDVNSKLLQGYLKKKDVKYVLQLRKPKYINLM